MSNSIKGKILVESDKEQPLSYSAESFSQAIWESFPEAILVIDESLKIVFNNLRAESLFGYSRFELIGKNISILFPTWNDSELASPMKNSIPKIHKYFGIDKNKQEINTELSIANCKVKGKMLAIVSVRNKTSHFEDSTNLKLKNAQLAETNRILETLAKTDPLTELLNRRGMESVLNREIEIAKRNSTELLAALFDLDDFKKINDTMGHTIGDIVLKTSAKTLKDELRAADWIGRVGGDEFLVLLPNTSLASGANVAERMRLALNQNVISTPNGQIQVTSSIGLISLPKTVSSIEEILELAKVTLKLSKEQGKNRVTYGEGNNEDINLNCPDLLKELLAGSKSYRAVAQKIVSLSDESIQGYELFTRGPKGPLEMPNEFFRVSKSHNILTTVDLHCLDVCLESIKLLPEHSSFHINILPSTLIEIPITTLVDRLKTVGQNRKVFLELSERKIFSEPTFLLKYIEELKKNNISIVLDDIGYGYSSLETILVLEPDLIKIDRSLVKDVYKHTEHRKALQKLVKMIKAIGVDVVAEGIENKEDLLILKEMGIQFGQGWYWGQPT